MSKTRKDQDDKDPLKMLMAAADTRRTHDTASLRALGGEFYTVGEQQWCDTAIASWRLEGTDLWVRVD